ncbi:uncharacterized protein LOC111005497 [Momordica charantia]|uniref:Uncharacterized protein LOC111005497 n=1 Tax=Momordica charantia TaxID=3673 RepID=A0A6J1BTV0_MOMCH|nr:uncharacterized protein LOC111005497 [Momordica charantia]
MGCLDTYKNPDQKGHCPPMSPRLSFSNDFVESQSQSHHKKEEKAPKLDQFHFPTPNSTISSDFEFSSSSAVTTMAAADELFLKGKLLPTLRDQLLLHDDDDGTAASSFGLPKWKAFLSLKRPSAQDG